MTDTFSASDTLLKEYETNGFAILRGVVDPALIEECHAHVAWLGRKYPDLRPEEYHHPLMRNDAFWVRMVSDSRLVDIAERFLGPDVACFTAHYVCKPPYDGRPVLWHQDGAYWKLTPMEALTVWLAVDHSNRGNGCLRMIPGSHVLPIHPPVSRTDVPNMLFSEAKDDLVAEWAAKAGVVEIELEPGDVSIHHPNLLHYSEPNTSADRRCGLDIGYMAASTSISNEGLYMDPLLVRGNPVPGVNSYRSWPRWNADETVPFRGDAEWDARAAAADLRSGARTGDRAETPLQVTHRMVARLQEGTVTR
ncbi:phytanoyl-CoA dioxygenase family protein [Kitasatospora phosalacinea]|uniref:phytanoyl-CoA dioxygenase family protein n=1 Tax=Kitasatospora phosalacinea TaxID=2065 RepID=UPI00068CCDD7|nr:phytanoyl-CoA dioxygenase family protein [Kitasatospora phosalacinea]